MKNFVPKDGSSPPGSGGGRNAERDLHGEKRSNATHCSTTDPDTRLFRKGTGEEAKLCHMRHLMMENRNALIVDARLTEANGTAERATTLVEHEATSYRLLRIRRGITTHLSICRHRKHRENRSQN